MQLGTEGIKLIQSYETFQPKAYFATDAEAKIGIYTIGWGHYDKAIKKGETWSRAKADAVFKQDARKFENVVAKQVKVPLTQNQFDALVSFAFNLGGFIFNGQPSTLLKLLNKGDYKGASEHFKDFSYQGKTYLRGLNLRRLKEKALFLKAVKKTEVKTDKNQDAVNKAKAKATADKNAEIKLQEKLTAEDRRQELAETNTIKKAELSKDAQAIAKAKATAIANEKLRATAQALAKAKANAKIKANELAEKNSYNANNPIKNTPSAPADAKEKTLPSAINKISSSKVLKSGISILGLFLVINLMNEIDAPQTELE
jgi:lysozyme